MSQPAIGRQRVIHDDYQRASWRDLSLVKPGVSEIVAREPGIPGVIRTQATRVIGAEIRAGEKDSGRLVNRDLDKRSYRHHCECSVVIRGRGIDQAWIRLTDGPIAWDSIPVQPAELGCIPGIQANGSGV